MKSLRTFDTMVLVQSLKYLRPPSLLVFYFHEYVALPAAAVAAAAAAPAPAVAVQYYVPLVFGCLLP
jgi:hypothetical protein